MVCGPGTTAPARRRRISNKCVIHTFDRIDYFNSRNITQLAAKAGVNFHHTSLGERTEAVKNGKRFKEIITNLKHQGKTIDIMKIDIEGSEWEQFQDWLDDWKEMGVTVRQVQIEVHKSPLPQTVDFFNAMWERGYVIFHKEPNYINTECIEFAFILLDSDFKNKD